MYDSEHPLFSVVAGCGMTGPDPKHAHTRDDGVIIPLGPGINTSTQNSSLLYNEYPFRFLVEIKYFCF